MHKASYRVYYEDTDAGGVVYASNYFDFAERARTDMLRDAGIIQSELMQEDIIFVVRQMEADLKRSARLDDMLDIETQIIASGGASLTMQQTISCQGNVLVVVTVKIACVHYSTMKPARLPAVLKDKLFF